MSSLVSSLKNWTKSLILQLPSVFHCQNEDLSLLTDFQYLCWRLTVHDHIQRSLSVLYDDNGLHRHVGTSSNGTRTAKLLAHDLSACFSFRQYFCDVYRYHFIHLLKLFNRRLCYANTKSEKCRLQHMCHDTDLNYQHVFVCRYLSIVCTFQQSCMAKQMRYVVCRDIKPFPTSLVITF